MLELELENIAGEYINKNWLFIGDLDRELLIRWTEFKEVLVKSECLVATIVIM
jgi:hypothetical protein